MYDRQKLYAALRGEEELVDHVYYDTANPPQLTVGVGHNLTAKGIPEEVLPLLHGFGSPTDLGYAWPEEALLKLLELDVNDAEADLDRVLPEWRGFPDGPQQAFVDLMFNMGPHKLGGFRNTLAAARSGDWAGVIAGLRDSAWWREVGTRGPKVTALFVAQPAGDIPA